MSKDLIMDVSKELFKLDKTELNFTINSAMISKPSSSSSHSVHLKPLSETEVTVTNITSEYIALRTKTTKKDNTFTSRVLKFEQSLPVNLLSFFIVRTI